MAVRVSEHQPAHHFELLVQSVNAVLEAEVGHGDDVIFVSQARDLGKRCFARLLHIGAPALMRPRACPVEILVVATKDSTSFRRASALGSARGVIFSNERKRSPGKPMALSKRS